MKGREPLGRGLSAILRDLEEKGTIRFIPVDEIYPNPHQPRFEIKEESLADLASSIKEKGLLQPIIIRKTERGYEIIAGERRFRASVMVGLKEVPAIVRDVDEKEALEIALMENLQREDLNPLEVATVYERFIKDFGYTHEELAKKLGVNRTSVTNYIRLLKLPDYIKDMIKDGRLSQGHARALLSLKDEREQKKYVEWITRGRVSVRELERKVRQTSREKDTYFSRMEEELKEILGTKVSITFKKNKGKIIIEFYSKEDLLKIKELIFRPYS